LGIRSYAYDERGDDVESVVEQDLLAPLELRRVDRRRDGDAQLAPTGEDVDRAVLELGHEHAVAARGLGEAVDLLLEGDDLRPSLLEGGNQTLVVLGQSGQLSLGRGDAVLKLANVSGVLRQLAPNQGELLLQERDLSGEIVRLSLPACGSCIRILTACHVPPPRGVCAARRRAGIGQGDPEPQGETCARSTLTVLGDGFPHPSSLSQACYSWWGTFIG
jgi:hypothetical protein